MNTAAKLTIIGVVVLAAIGAIAMKQRNTTPASQATAAAPSTAPSTAPASAPSDEPAVEPTRPLPRLVDLGADRCIPCKAMAPILDELSSNFRGQFDVMFIDVWKDRAAAEPYGIRMIPTQIFLDADGKELFRHEGFFSREDILTTWRRLGYGFGGPAEAGDG